MPGLKTLLSPADRAAGSIQGPCFQHRGPGMLAVLADPPHRLAAATRQLIWTLLVSIEIPILYKIRPDGGQGAVADASFPAALRAADPVIAAEGGSRHPGEVTSAATPLYLLLVPKADLRRPQLVFLVPLLRQCRVRGHGPAATEAAGFALAKRAGVSAAVFRHIAHSGIPLVHLATPGAARALQPDLLAAAMCVVAGHCAFIFDWMPHFLSQMVLWVC